MSQPTEIVSARTSAHSRLPQRFHALSRHPHRIAFGLVMLPFNVRHLGPAAYGLWILTASVTVHFSVLDLGTAVPS